MEVRTIKTCYGLKELRFLDGALVSDGADLQDVAIPPEVIAELNRLIRQAYLSSRLNR